MPVWRPRCSPSWTTASPVNRAWASGHLGHLGHLGTHGGSVVCEAQWGPLVKQRAVYTAKQVTDVRSGRHRCFDRLVVDLDRNGKGRPRYQVGYVKPMRQTGPCSRAAAR
jgi:hypothetical protein